MGDKPIWEQIGSSFIQHYYQLFDNDRTQLGAIYVLIKVNFENVSLSQLSLDETKKKVFVHAGTGKKHIPGDQEQ